MTNREIETMVRNQRVMIGGLLGALESSSKLPIVMSEPDFAEDDNEASRENAPSSEHDEYINAHD